MSRKDYIRAAEIAGHMGAIHGERVGADLRERLSNWFASDNPSFIRDRFIAEALRVQALAEGVV